MPEYEDILKFLAKNPPNLASERQLHASMLELLASCLRNQENEKIDINPVVKKAVESQPVA